MAQDEDKQMVLAFMAEAEDVDPVSGNEVPPGSLPEEVRDDIPARLSEGEYVVPADVLRFYGVKFFEDLRENAKRELARMDREGRIGGEPIPNEELSDAEKAELKTAVGGFITGQPTQSTMPDPYQQQQMMYRQGAPVAMGNAGYQEGGLEDGSEPTYTDEQLRNAFAPGFSFLDTPSLQPADAQFTPVMMYKQGENPTMALTKQQYDIMLSNGWSTEQVKITTETSVGEQQGGGGGSTPPQEVEELEIEDMSDDDLLKTARGFGVLNNVATAVASAAGLPVAAIVNTTMIAKYNDTLAELDERKIEHGLERKGSIFGGESTLFEGLEDTDGKKGASFGDTWLGDLLGFDKNGFGVQGDNLRDSFGGSRRDGITDKGGSSKSNKSSSNIVKDPDPDKYESDVVTRDAFEDISPSTPPAMTNPSSGAQ